MTYSHLQHMANRFVSLLTNNARSPEESAMHHHYVENSAFGVKNPRLVRDSDIKDLVPWALLSDAKDTRLVVDSSGTVRGATLELHYQYASIEVNTVEKIITVSHQNRSIVEYVGTTVLDEMVHEEIVPVTIARLTGEPLPELNAGNPFDRVRANL